jgi:CHAD domain-containing protein
MNMLSMPDEGYCLLGAESLLKRIKALRHEIDGVRHGQDIEYIHRMRVASRRLRAAFALFQECLPQDRVKEWRRRIRRITRALGAARDADVQIDFLQTFLQQMDDSISRCKSGIRRILLRLQQEREDHQQRVERALDRLENSGILSEMEHDLQSRLARARLLHLSMQTPLAYAHAREAITERLTELLTFEPYVYQSQRMEKLHEMRIAAKRLRYTLEIFMPLYGKQFDKPLKLIKEVQERLGSLHDCDVWVQFLDEFAQEERRRTLNYFGRLRPFSALKPGIQYLALDRQHARQQVYNEFVKFWKGVESQNVWETLLKSIEEKSR